ncbi:LysE family transporter [Candidatus Bathyarchaeota archaeon]|nr:LysE family transporter [Candidatus Bathyarchaeota archaeon]
MPLMLDIAFFLTSVVLISMSGVMMPGPVTTVAVAKGRESGLAGALIALGHGAVEIPLMILIYLGFAQFFSYEIVRRAIGLAGGLMLGSMGIQMFRTSNYVEEERGGLKLSSVFSGVATTGANPYFYLWWATIGSALVLNSALFGLTGFLLFALVHWSCDLFWYLFISQTVYRSRRLWSPMAHRIVYGVCSAILIVFGVWFTYSAAK